MTAVVRMLVRVELKALLRAALLWTSALVVIALIGLFRPDAAWVALSYLGPASMAILIAEAFAWDGQEPRARTLEVIPTPRALRFVAKLAAALAWGAALHGLSILLAFGTLAVTRFTPETRFDMLPMVALGGVPAMLWFFGGCLLFAPLARNGLVTFVLGAGYAIAAAVLYAWSNPWLRQRGLGIEHALAVHLLSAAMGSFAGFMVSSAFSGDRWRGAASAAAGTALGVVASAILVAMGSQVAQQS
ncbi:MAG: hypothetical protein JNJ88_21250 [Planctomycetes bacterium]|nr:hypothetical protein [Planctomycetota bacterium]